MIEVENLKKSYGQKQALKGVSFRLAGNKIYGLLGQNGAGKSTTMNLLTGCLVPDEGSVLINGFDMRTQPEEAKRCIGYLPEIPPLYPDMTPREFLSFVAEAKKVPGALIAGQVHDLLEKTCLLSVENRIIRNLSKGYRQRIGIAMALVGDPDIIVLDEPTVGLDPKQIVDIRALIKSLGGKHTVLFSSHILSEVSEICDRILILSDGNLVTDDTKESLESRTGSASVYRISVRGTQNAILPILSAVETVANVRVLDAADGVTTLQVEAIPGKDPRDDVFFALADKRMAVLSAEQIGNTLEDVFLDITSKQNAGGDSVDTKEDSEA